MTEPNEPLSDKWLRRAQRLNTYYRERLSWSVPADWPSDVASCARLRCASPPFRRSNAASPSTAFSAQDARGPRWRTFTPPAGEFLIVRGETAGPVPGRHLGGARWPVLLRKEGPDQGSGPIWQGREPLRPALGRLNVGEPVLPRAARARTLRSPDARRRRHRVPGPRPRRGARVARGRRQRAIRLRRDSESRSTASQQVAGAAPRARRWARRHGSLRAPRLLRHPEAAVASFRGALRAVRHPA